MLGDASMVLSLERIRQYEDKNLLAAHVMVLLDRDHNTAQVRVYVLVLDEVACGWGREELHREGLAPALAACLSV